MASQTVKARSIKLEDINYVAGFTEPEFDTYTFGSEYDWTIKKYKKCCICNAFCDIIIPVEKYTHIASRKRVLAIWIVNQSRMDFYTNASLFVRL